MMKARIPFSILFLSLLLLAILFRIQAAPVHVQVEHDNKAIDIEKRGRDNATFMQAFNTRIGTVSKMTNLTRGFVIGMIVGLVCASSYCCYQTINKKIMK